MNGEVGYCEKFNIEIRPLLDQYDIIRHHLVDDPDLHGTSIVVIGDQSSGKSSVLESLVQIGLPRGENIVTRMPIILQCRSLRASNSKEFPHAKISISSPSDKRSFTITDFSQIERTIMSCQETVLNSMSPSGASNGATNNTAANSKNTVSDIPIYVQVVKAGIPDVTLVDLPGINYSNESIKGQITKLYEKFLSPENVIILNVISAVTDLQANESVLFAHKVDPLEKRTISVLTKLDKCSEGDVKSKLEELRSTGARFVLVRNRTPEEIAMETPWDKVRELEKECLSKWGDVSSSSKGVPALSAILVSEGYKMVLQSIEQLSAQVPNLLSQLQNDLTLLGQPCDTEMEKKSRFDEISRGIGSRLRQLLDGLSKHDDESEMFLNSNIQSVLDNYRQLFFATQKTIFSNSFKAQIEQSLSKTVGINLPNFLSHPVFKLMLDRMIMKTSIYNVTTHDLMLGSYEDSSSHSGVIDYVNIIVGKLLLEVLQTRPLDDKFERRLADDIRGVLRTIGAETCKFLKQLIDAELVAGPYTADSSYVTTIQRIEDQIKQLKDKDGGRASDSAVGGAFGSAGSSGMGSIFGGPKPPQGKSSASSQTTPGRGTGVQILLGDDTSLDISEVESIVNSSASVKDLAVFQMQISLFAYWSILQRRMTDHVHLVVRSGLCFEMRKWEELMEALWRRNRGLYVQILQEKPEVQEKRSIFQKRIQNLKRASEVLTSLGT